MLIESRYVHACIEIEFSWLHLCSVCLTNQSICQRVVNIIKQLKAKTSFIFSRVKSVSTATIAQCNRLRFIANRINASYWAY